MVKGYIFFFIFFFEVVAGARNGKQCLRHGILNRGKVSCWTAVKTHLKYLYCTFWMKRKKKRDWFVKSASKGQESSPPGLTFWSCLKSLALIWIIISVTFLHSSYDFWLMPERSNRMNNCHTWSLAVSIYQHCSQSLFSGLFLRADTVFSWGFLLIFKQVKLTYSWHAQEPVSILSSMPALKLFEGIWAKNAVVTWMWIWWANVIL